MFSALRRNLRYSGKRKSEDLMSNRHYIKRGISYLKRNGIGNTLSACAEKLSADSGYVRSPASEEMLAAQREHVFENPYKFSILVPVYETDPVMLRSMLDSVGDQTYGNWELILADASSDDLRRNIVRSFTEDYNLNCKDAFGSIYDKVRYERLTSNLGISGNTNEAMKHASGDYVGLLDHDDLLENTALFDIMCAIEEKESKGRTSERITRVMAVYTDEDKVSEDGSSFFEPNYKPDFDPVMLCTNNYICHFFVVDATLAKGTGGFRSAYDGAQDHDFIIRCTEELKSSQILHVPKVLYHWRTAEGSTSGNPDSKLYAYEAGKRAVSERLKRAGIDAEIEDSAHMGFFDIRYAKTEADVLTVTPEELAKMAGKRESFSGREYIMVLSPSLEPKTADYIDEMLPCMQFDCAGAVTGRLIGRNRKVESAGYDIDENQNAVPRFSGLKRNFSGYMHRAVTDQLVDGFSQDCVLLRVDAVSSFAPEIVLKGGYRTYFRPEAEFVRKIR